MRPARLLFPQASLSRAGAPTRGNSRSADVSGTRKLDTVQFFRDNTIIHTESLSEEKASIEFTDESPLPGEHIYWLRVTQLPETAPNKNPAWGVAYSSPIWIKNSA